MDIKGFLLRFFAIVGLVSAFAIGMGVWGLFNFMVNPSSLSPVAKIEAPKKMVLDLDLTRPLSEQPAGFRLSLPSLLDEEDGQDYFTLVRAILRAKDDPRVLGLAARLGPERPSFAHVQELAAALRSFRQSGKPAYIFAPSYGDFAPGGGGIYALAAQFERIWLQPVGAVGLTGLAIEVPFAKSALAKWGVQGDFLRREEYKSVMENLTENAFSPPVKENMTAMMDSLASQIAQEIAKGRKIEEKAVRALMAEGPYTAQEALKAGLVTEIGYEDEMLAALEAKVGSKAETMEAGRYLDMPVPDEKGQESKARIALIYAEGILTDVPPKGPSRLTREDAIDTQEVVKAFEKAAADKTIKAILFRVNSPGGSPVASESIRRALIRAKQAGKPVFVSMGSVAASGGYWISMNADRILADPSSLTGSIGVVAGKFVVRGLADKLDVHTDGMATSDTATMTSPFSPFSAKARARMDAMLDETYKAFTDNVAAARKIDPARMPQIAKGRVYTGAQALEVSLVDELGGLQETVDALKKELKLDPKDKVALVQIPQPETPESLLKKAFGAFRFGGAALADLTRLAQQAQTVLAPLLSAIEQDRAVRVRYQGPVLDQF